MRMSELKALAKGADGRSRAAAAALEEAAAREGLLDVAYGFVDSPFGRLLVAVTPRGLVRLAYPDRPVDAELAELSREVSPRVLESPRATDQVRRELAAYFEGTRHGFDLPVDLSPLH